METKAETPAYKLGQGFLRIRPKASRPKIPRASGKGLLWDAEHELSSVPVALDELAISAV